jgi:predicted metal-dependent phosphoesterase TrpH
MSFIDLHMHSVYSCDGEIPPKGLLEIAARQEIRTISLTDHNTCKGVHEAIDAGKTENIAVIPGIELDCFYQGILFHLLGYGINPDNFVLHEIDKHVCDINAASSQTTIHLINEVGIELDGREALSRSKNNFVTGELIAEIVLNKPNAVNNPLLQPYLPGGVRSDNPYVNFYWDYCGQGKPAYVPIEYISMEEALSAVRGAGGLAILAHPGQNLKGKEGMLSSIIALGIDGLEVYSSYHSPEVCTYYRKQAEVNKLLVTCGSDFHGKTKPSIRMGIFGLSDDGHAILDALTVALNIKKRK